jgi:hypothetical protein
VIEIGATHPGGDRISVVLIAIAAFACEAAVPEGRIDLNHSLAPRRYLPAVERPEMHSASQMPAEMAQPGQPSMGGLRHRALHIEMEDRLGRARPILG